MSRVNSGSFQLKALSPSEIWKRGVFGFFLRIRGQITSVVVVLASACGKGFWNGTIKAAGADPAWPDQAWAVGWYFLSDPLGTAALALAITVVVATWICRWLVMHSLDCKKNLHDAIHMIRDVAFEIMGDTEAPGAKLEGFLNTASLQTAEVFRKWARASDLECYIYLSATDSNIQGYRLLGLSSRQPDSLHKLGDFVPLSDDLVDATRDSDHRGIVTVRVDLMPDQTSTKQSISSRLVTDDKEQSILAPVNGFKGTIKEMAAIIQIVSCSKKLRPEHSLGIALIADVLGFVLPVLGQHIRKHGSLKLE